MGAERRGVPVASATRRYRARVAYDGSAWSGWQNQLDVAPSVQGALEQALSTVLRCPVRVEGAGRTDAGVHARGQVIAFDTSLPVADAARLVRSVNALLGDSAAIRDLEPVAADFDPRRHALSRLYRYRIWTDSVLDPFERGRVWHLPGELDRQAMSQAAADVVGEHDFRSFQASDNRPRASIRRVIVSAFESCDSFLPVTPERHGEMGPVATSESAALPPSSLPGALLVYRVEANAFCRGMVRKLVGTLLEIGRGRLRPDAIRELLATPEPARAPRTAPPRGLFLDEVRYS